MRENGVVDKAAKNSTKFPKISLNIHPTASNLARIFKTLIFLEKSNHDKKLLKIMKESLL